MLATGGGFAGRTGTQGNPILRFYFSFSVLLLRLINVTVTLSFYSPVKMVYLLDAAMRGKRPSPCLPCLTVNFLARSLRAVFFNFLPLIRNPARVRALFAV